MAKSNAQPGPVGRMLPDAGVVAVEFALVAPLFLLLIFATMVFALYFATFVAVIHAANEGARASVGGISDTERASLANTRIQQVFGGYSMLNSASVTVQTNTPAPPTGYFKVKVSYPLSSFGFGTFYNLMAFVTPGAGVQPVTVTYTVTVADGGY